MREFIYPLITPIGFVFFIALLACLVGLFSQRKGSVLVWFAILLLWIFSTKLVGQWAFEKLESAYPPVPIAQQPIVDAIVVLGGGIGNPESPRVELEFGFMGDRLLHAARLYKAGKSEKIIVTGGNASLELKISAEADYMLSLLSELGVPEHVVVKEQHSSNTVENAANTAALFNNPSSTRILLVTSAFHMQRAVAVFESEGFIVVAASTDIHIPNRKNSLWSRVIPSSTGLALISNAFNEYLALLVFKLGLKA